MKGRYQLIDALLTHVRVLSNRPVRKSRHTKNDGMFLLRRMLADFEKWSDRSRVPGSIALKANAAFGEVVSNGFLLATGIAAIAMPSRGIPKILTIFPRLVRPPRIELGLRVPEIRYPIL